jgi:hypothetical protein
VTRFRGCPAHALLGHAHGQQGREQDPGAIVLRWMTGHSAMGGLNGAVMVPEDVRVPGS